MKWFARLILVLLPLVALSLGCAGLGTKIRDGGDKVGAVTEFLCELPVGLIAEGAANIADSAEDVLDGDEKKAEASP